MVNTSKILTVSYGTFSCTLEGFDDSFETMKAIAEYFRDLAADDRYFGAEPPTPDADMLARIAEREIARRVEAHEEQGKIVLRAEDAPALAAAADAALSEPAAAPAPVAPQVDEIEEPTEEMPEEAVAEAPADEVAEPVDEEPVVEEPAAEAPAAEDVVEAEQEEVEAVEEAVTPENLAGEAEEDAVDLSPAMASDTVSEDDAPAEMEAEPEAAVDLSADASQAPVTEDITSEQSDDEDVILSEEAFFQNSPQPDAPAFYEGEEAETPIADSDSVAAKLSRIRSVVSQNDQSYEADDYSEDEHAQDFLNEAAADLDAALAVDDAAELEAEDPSEDQPLSDAELLKSLAGKRAREIEELSAAPAEEPETDEVPVLDEADAEDGLEDTLSQLLADSISAEDEAESVEITPEEAPADEAITEEAPIEALSGEDAFEEEAAGHEEVADLVSDEEDAASDDDATHDPVNARVIKMSNEDFEAALSESMAEEDADAGASEEVTEDLLSPEQEEDLQRALAQVEADLPAAETDEEDAVATDDMESDTAADLAENAETADAEEEAAPAATLEGRHKFDAADGNSDIERIFDEADSQLEKPESNQRRSAIQHLRAAVAATRAEKKAGADLQKNVDDAPYRSDLASVVRPRRPSTTDGARSERPSESRPAPLKLVAEQRVDTDQAPVRPRRVSAAVEQAEKSETAEASDSNFTEYAREMGATQLPELLEAAAAYMSDVEGRAQFSRPMLMHKLQEVEKENFSREDGLRSFGKLLRDGKIQKIKGGRFTVTDETEFRGEARHAG